MKNYKIDNNKVYGFEPFFNHLVVVANIDHENKEVRPTHGYFFPHKHGKYSKKIAKELAYSFNNN